MSSASTFRGRRMMATGALSVLLALAGCASPPGQGFSAPDAAFAWPPPPDQPRIYWIGQLRGEADLQAGRSVGRQIADALFGRETPQEFVAPLGVCTDGVDRVFVTDSGARVVHVLNLRTRAHERWQPPAGRAILVQPVASAWLPTGRLLVSDSGGGVIHMFDGGGGYLGHFAPGSVVRPCGIAVDHAGRVIVADPGAHEVLVLSADGELLHRIGGRGIDPGKFNFPTYVAVSEDQRLYVSDSLNFRVQVFGPDFEPLTVIGSKGDMPGYFSQPKGIALDRLGRLYVVDSNFESVQVFTGDGTLLMTFGREGRRPGEFWLPTAVFADGQDRLWITDSYNRRVQVFEFQTAENEP
jgi:sugar lactone lactonase YvrE